MQIIATVAAMGHIIVVALAAPSAHTILPTLDNAPLALPIAPHLCMLHWGQLLINGEVGARYPPWHIPPQPVPWHSITLLQPPMTPWDTWYHSCLSCSLPQHQRGETPLPTIRIMLQKRGGAHQTLQKMPNTMAKTMSFLSLMQLLESRGGWLHLKYSCSYQGSSPTIHAESISIQRSSFWEGKRPRAPPLHLFHHAGRRTRWTTSSMFWCIGRRASKFMR